MFDPTDQREIDSIPFPNLEEYDTEYRPKSYFVMDPETAIVSRIKGAARRDTVRLLGVDGVDADMRSESLSDEERAAVGGIHPSLMGGEYLPDQESNEVEIARVDLDSVTSDVLSLRARWQEGWIQYRFVDEYDSVYEIKPERSKQPLTFGELVGLINSIGGSCFPRAVREVNYSFEWTEHNARACSPFSRFSSDFYPELGAYYQEEADCWLEAKLEEIRGRE